MNTRQMNGFLLQVSQAHAQEFIVMVVDGASSHKAKELVVPENIRLIRLPGYSRSSIPKNTFGMKCGRRPFRISFWTRWSWCGAFDGRVERAGAEPDRVRSIAAWPWIVSLNLKAN